MNEILTVSDIEKLLRVSRTVAYQLVNEPDFPKVRIGRSIRIPAEAFQRWVDSKTEVNRFE